MILDSYSILNNFSKYGSVKLDIFSILVFCIL